MKCGGGRKMKKQQGKANGNLARQRVIAIVPNGLASVSASTRSGSWTTIVYVQGILKFTLFSRTNNHQPGERSDFCDCAPIKSKRDFEKFTIFWTTGLKKLSNFALVFVEWSEGLLGSVAVIAERANGVVGEGRSPTFCTVTGYGLAYFNKLSRNFSLVYM